MKHVTDFDHVMFVKVIVNFSSIVEVFPVGLATGRTPRAADASCAGPHSTPRSTNIFMEALSEGVYDGPD